MLGDKRGVELSAFQSALLNGGASFFTQTHTQKVKNYHCHMWLSVGSENTRCSRNPPMADGGCDTEQLDDILKVSL